MRVYKDNLANVNSIYTDVNQKGSLYPSLPSYK